jgi:hypothetical protein
MVLFFYVVVGVIPTFSSPIILIFFYNVSETNERQINQFAVSAELEIVQSTSDV